MASPGGRRVGRRKETGEDREVSESGQPIFRHRPREKEFELAIGDERSIERIARHIEAHIGKIEMVFHELISDLVHIDVYWVKPTPGRDFHTLITTGMSDRPMTVPEGEGTSPYAELMICLPSSWPISREAFKDEENLLADPAPEDAEPVASRI